MVIPAVVIRAMVIPAVVILATVRWRSASWNRFLKNVSGVRTLTTFYLAKNDHRWVTFISLKTIGVDAARELMSSRRTALMLPTAVAAMFTLLAAEKNKG